MRNKVSFKGAAADSILLAVVKIITMLVGILCTMVLSRALTLESYGTFSQANLVISIVSSITVLGLSDASNYFFNRDGSGNVYISNILGLQMAIGIIAALAIILGQSLICGYFANPALAGMLFYIAFRPYLNNALASLQVLLVSMGKARLLVARNLIVSIVKVVVVTLVALSTKDIGLIFLAYLTVDACNYIWFGAVYVTKCGFPRIGDLSLGKLKEILIFSIPMAAAVLMSALSREMAKLVIGANESTAGYAVFANCSAQLPLDFVAASFLTVLMPVLARHIAKGELLDAQGIYRSYLTVGYYLVWPLAACLAVLSKECVLVLYGDQYISGVAVFAVFVAVYALTFFESTLVLSSSGKTRILMVIALVALLANAFLSISFYFLFGFIGPALAALAANVIMALLMLWFSCRALDTSITLAVNAPEMLRVLVQLVVLSGMSFIVRYYLESIGIHYLMRVAIVMVLYIGIFYCLNIKRVKSILGSINRIK